MVLRPPPHADIVMRMHREFLSARIIGRRHVTYIFSPNGKVEIAVKSSDTPFRLETDQDESVILSEFCSDFSVGIFVISSEASNLIRV